MYRKYTNGDVIQYSRVQCIIVYRFSGEAVPRWSETKCRPQKRSHESRVIAHQLQTRKKERINELKYIYNFDAFV